MPESASREVSTWGVSAPGGGGVCSQAGGICSGGGVCSLGGVCSGGCLLPGGVCSWGGVCSQGCVASQHALRQTPPLWTESQTPVKTLPRPNFVAAGKISAEILIKTWATMWMVQLKSGMLPVYFSPFINSSWYCLWKLPDLTHGSEFLWGYVRKLHFRNRVLFVKLFQDSMEFNGKPHFLTKLILNVFSVKVHFYFLSEMELSFHCRSKLHKPVSNYPKLNSFTSLDEDKQTSTFGM